MKTQNLSDIEQQIRDLVSDAIDTMDFQRLNEGLSSTVNQALREIKDQLNQTGRRMDRQRPVDTVFQEVLEEEEGRLRGEKQTGRPGRQTERDKRRRETEAGRSAREEKSADRDGWRETRMGQREGAGGPWENKGRHKVRVKTAGKVAGILFTVFGGIGLFATCIGLFVASALSMVAGTLTGGYGLSFFFLFVLVGIFGGMCGYGGSIRRRLKRMRRYVELMRGRPYCSVKELAAYVGKTEKYVLKDLQKMIGIGIFPEGHLDKQGTCLMLDDATYGQYLEAQKSLEERERLQRAEAGDGVTGAGENAWGVGHSQAGKGKRQEGDWAKPEDPKADPELEALVNEGRAYMRKLREINEVIPGEVISQKLYRLETVTGRIFDCVKKHPGQMPQMRKFMDYYLPTTLKLVTAYQEFDGTLVQGGNITAAKAEIEKTLDTINAAFEKLLDDLYQDAVFDVTTDASVLQAMLAREGLTGSDFKEE